jgi:cytidylate kinase
MRKMSLASYIGCFLDDSEKHKEPGPFVALSRQYGCGGYVIGQLLADKLNAGKDDTRNCWKLFNKFILNQMAEETNLTVELLERERRSKPSIVLDFFRAIGSERIPSGFEIRKRITILMRGLAVRGNAILVGQGGAFATVGIPRGLSVRLVAPLDWRIAEIARQQGIDAGKAEEIIEAKEQEREYLRELYARQTPNEVPYKLVIDCSVFTSEEIAQFIVHALEVKGYVGPTP